MQEIQKCLYRSWDYLLGQDVRFATTILANGAALACGIQIHGAS